MKELIRSTIMPTARMTRLSREQREQLPPQRMLKMFGMLRTERINNARTRRLILSTLLGADNLEFWAVKYRCKLATALVHAWGRRTAGIVRVHTHKDGVG